MTQNPQHSADLQALRIERGPRPAARRRRRLWWLLPLVAVLGVGLYLPFAPTSHAVQTARIARVWPSSAIALLNATGYVVAARKAAVATKATGRLEWLGVEEGSRVQAGDLIARLENADVVAQLALARAGVAVATARVGEAAAELADAERDLQRNRELLAKGVNAQANFDAAQARAQSARAAQAAAEAGVRQAEAQVQAAQVDVEQTLIRAPFDGVVVAKNADVGDVVSPFNTALDAKGAVVSMVDFATLEIEADVAESSLAQVQVGQPAEIQLDAFPDLRLAGAVERIVPTVDRSKATVQVKVKLLEREPRLLPDMSARVLFLRRPLHDNERTARVAVPAAALVGAMPTAAPTSARVFRVRDDRAQAVTVQLGERLGDAYTVTGGLAPDDEVILDPPADLADGAAITRQEAAGAG